MASIADIMLGVEARLETIEGLRIAAYIRDQINPPAAVVGVPPIPEYHMSMTKRGRLQLALSVTVLVGSQLDRVGQLKLAAYADPSGPQSVKAAIEADQSLGGTVEQCYVSSFRPLGLEEVGVINYYGGIFELVTVARGA